MGHYNNPITVCSAHVTGSEAQRVATGIISKISPADRRAIQARISDHMDEKSNLYLRLDKQAVFSGRILLSDSDSIWVRIKPDSPRDSSGMISLLKESVA